MSVAFGTPPQGGNPKQPKKPKPLTVESLKRKAKREYKKAVKEGDEETAKMWKEVIEAEQINISEGGAWQVALTGPKKQCWKCQQENYPVEDVDKFWGYECSCGIRDTEVKNESHKLQEYFTGN